MAEQPRFLLDQRIPIPGGGWDDASYTNYWGYPHHAQDYQAVYVPFYAHLNLTVTREAYGQEGGNWIEMVGSDLHKIKCAHLKEYRKPLGSYPASTLLAITGNTGGRKNAAGVVVAYQPHLHCEVYNPQGVRIPPEPYFTNLLTPKPMDTKVYNNHIVRCEDSPEARQAGLAGSFAYYIEGRGKQKITRDNAGIAVITYLQRLPDKIVVPTPPTGQPINVMNIVKAWIVNVPYSVWMALPDTPTGFF